MASSIEDILYAKALAEASGPDLGTSIGIGAVGGATLGATLGEIPHQMGRAFNGVGTGVMTAAGNPKMNGDSKVWRGGANRPGFRFAGGLVGAILGGALGAGVRDTMIRSSPQLQRVMAEQEITGML